MCFNNSIITGDDTQDAIAYTDGVNIYLNSGYSWGDYYSKAGILIHELSHIDDMKRKFSETSSDFYYTEKHYPGLDTICALREQYAFGEQQGYLYNLTPKQKNVAISGEDKPSIVSRTLVDISTKDKYGLVQNIDKLNLLIAGSYPDGCN